MLAADKLQLQSALKQQATALKEKEFNLHHSNFMTVGTQAAVLAGLDITLFVEFNPPSATAWQEEHRWLCHWLRALYYAIIIAAFCANMIVVSQTTALSVLGAGLALRGPDGSMVTATDGLYEERKSVFKTFALGLSLTVGSLLIGVWLLLEWQSALVCWLVALFTSRKIYLNYRRIATRFDFDEADTVDFTDIFQGPAAIRTIPGLNHVVFGNGNTKTMMTTSGGGGNKPSTVTSPTPTPTPQSSSWRSNLFFGRSSSSNLHKDEDETLHHHSMNGCTRSSSHHTVDDDGYALGHADLELQQQQQLRPAQQKSSQSQTDLLLTTQQRQLSSSSLVKQRRS